MGNKSSQIESLLNFQVQKLLELYTLICDSFDENLGRLKIYRKKQFNYDYIALSDKLIQRQSIEDCKNIINIYYQKKQKYINIQQFNKQKIIHNLDIWLKIYSCQIYQDAHVNSNFIPFKICFQYLNFTLKSYIEKNGRSLIAISQHQNQFKTIPKNLLYVLGCVLDAYSDLRKLHQMHPCLNIMSMVVSITTPSLIYINVDKCIKFLPLPLFIFSDNFSRLDQCMLQCCKYIDQDNINFRNNIVIPKYGSTNTTSYDKIDRLFINKFKKMVKYIHNQTMFIVKNRRSQQGSQAVTTHPQQNKSNNNLSLSNYGRQKLMGIQKINKKNNTNQNQQQFWDSIQNINNLQQLIKYIKNRNNFPQNLDFSLHTNALLEASRRRSQFSKQQKIKLQKYNKHRNSVNIISRINSHSQKIKDKKYHQYKINDNFNQININNKQYSLKNKISSSLNQNKINNKNNQNSCNKGIKGVINSLTHSIPQHIDNTDIPNINSKNKLQSILLTSGIKYSRASHNIRTLQQQSRWSRCIGTVQL